MKVNEGEVPQCYIENSHPATVSAEMFDIVLEELTCRKLMGRQHNGTSCFAGTIFCECCGGMYGSKVWHSNSQYHRVIWQCNAKFKDGHYCTTPHLTEVGIQDKFLNVFNQLLDQRDFIAKDIKIIVDFLTDTKALKSEAAELRDEMEIVTELMKQAIVQNASIAMDQKEYTARYNALAERYQNAFDRYKAIEAECASRTSQRKMLTSSAKQLMGSDEKVSEFTPTLWNTMVEKVTVDTDGILHFTFKNGTVLCA